MAVKLACLCHWTKFKCKEWTFFLNGEFKEWIFKIMNRRVVMDHKSNDIVKPPISSFFLHNEPFTGFNHFDTSILDTWALQFDFNYCSFANSQWILICRYNCLSCFWQWRVDFFYLAGMKNIKYLLIHQTLWQI